MQDAAWAIVLFGGIPATLIFLFWWAVPGQVAAQTKFFGLQVEPQEQVSDFKKARACPGLLCSQ